MDQKPIIINARDMSKTIVLAGAAISMILAAGVYWSIQKRPSGVLAIGDRAPEFELPALGSGTVALKDHRQHVVLVNFWATWCPPCVDEAPSLNAFADSTRRIGVAVIGVSVDRDVAELEKFVARYHLSFPMGRDPDQKLAFRFGTHIFPETYILDRDGVIAEKIVGPINWQDPRVLAFVRTLTGSPEPSAQ